jgi:hypothetical protein
MNEVRDSFYERTTEALAVALVPRDDDIPLVLLVVDDSGDDELVSVIAAAEMVPAVGYGGGWGAMVQGGADGMQLTVKFLLKGEEWERQWMLPDVTAEILRAITGGPHNVAVLPKELAGDLNAPVERARVAGALIVEARASDAVRKASLPFRGD